MLKLTYLSLDKDGNAQGPHVLLLSGTSWAKGAAKYHIWDKVSYILEAKEEVRTKIEQAEVFHIPTDVRVSGSNYKNRQALLSEVIRQSAGYIMHEIDTKPNGRILYIVNSYEEAKEAQACLSRHFPDDQVTRIEQLKRGKSLDYNLPTTSLDKLLISWLPGVVACNAISKMKPA